MFGKFKDAESLEKPDDWSVEVGKGDAVFGSGGDGHVNYKSMGW